VHLTRALVFYFEACFMFYFEYALSLYELVDTLVGLRLINQVVSSMV
jgi:hypothetical protein